MIDLAPDNPLDRDNLGGSVAEAMLERSAWLLSSVVEKPFKGAGIYALYYTGKFKSYKVMADRNREKRFEYPIYVGKAVPAGARKGNVGLTAP
jgi:Eco29kI restriction endonuclease